MPSFHLAQHCKLQPLSPRPRVIDDVPGRRCSGGGDRSPAFPMREHTRRRDPSELVKQFSLMVDSKISAAQVVVGESFAGLNDQIEALKKGKSVEGGTYILQANSAGTSATQDQFFGMPPNSFPGQTLLPSTVHAPPVPPVYSTGQTGEGGQTGYTIGQTGPTGQCPVPSALHASIPGSTVPSRTNEIVMHAGPHTTSQQGSGPH